MMRPCERIPFLLVLGISVAKFLCSVQFSKKLGNCLLGETEGNTGKDGQGVYREVNMEMKTSAVKATRE